MPSKLYLSINRLVERIHEKQLKAPEYDVIFDKDNVEPNNFGGVNVHVLALKIGVKVLNYSKLMELFGAELIISFKETSKRKIISSNYQVLRIQDQISTYMSNLYHQSSIHALNAASFTKKLIDDKVNYLISHKPETVTIDDDEDIEYI